MKKNEPEGTDEKKVVGFFYILTSIRLFEQRLFMEDEESFKVVALHMNN